MATRHLAPHRHVTLLDGKAKAAERACVSTYTASTADADFYGEGADAALLDLSAGVTADMLFDGGAVRGDRLAGLRDSK